MSTPVSAIQVTAFSDPNDLLTHTLVPRPFAARASYRIADRIVSVADTFLGLFENPMDAHGGCGKRAVVQVLMVCGKPAFKEYPAKRP